jgi:hypothetical protein
MDVLSTGLPISELVACDLPPELRCSTYFDATRPFAHADALVSDNTVATVLHLTAYARGWLEARRVGCCQPHTRYFPALPTQLVGTVVVHVEKGAVFLPSTVLGTPLVPSGAPTPPAYIYVAAGCRLVGCVLDASQGSIWVGGDSTVEPLASLQGPCVLGQRNTVRAGAYLRGGTVVGDDCVLRGETKNAYATLFALLTYLLILALPCSHPRTHA